MGRASSTGSSFLIERPDTGAFIYHRKLPEHLQALIVGVIALPWKSRLLEIDGPSTIKIALSTGDAAIARDRRDEVHVQIEDLVARAQARLNASNQAKLAAQVGRLTTAHIRHMAGQVRHDILADDDRTLVDPTHAPQLTDVLLKIMRDAGATGSSGGALRAAQDVARRMAEGDLASRDLALSDQRIAEGEIDASPELIDKLSAWAERRDPGAPI